jgi:WhiB family redox-sensing transcriptional regulator
VKYVPIPVGPDDWQRRAACLGRPAAWWFPERQRTGLLSYDLARPICARCVVRPVCREYAIINNITLGMWGGMTPKEREHLRRLRRLGDRDDGPTATD